MAGYLIIGGVDLDVVSTRRLAREMLGQTVRTALGTLRSTQRAGKRAWQVETIPYPVTERETIRAACNFGAPVAVGGTLAGFAGVGTITCIVEEQETEDVIDPSDATYGYQASLVLVIRES